MKLWFTILLWLLLNIIIGITMDFALFTQTTSNIKNQNIFIKLLTSEFWASIEWIFVIPANRIGNIFLTAPQLSLSSYVFDFLAQFWSNYYWLKLKTTIDDYVGMILILFGMYVSKFSIFG